MAQAPDIDFRFDLAPREAIAFFRAKGYRTGFSWQEVWGDEHDRAFTVAKMMELDLLSDTRAAVDRAITEGQSVGEFKRQLKPKLAAAGWWGRKEVRDPATGEMREVQLGSSRRLDTIFRVNLQTSYAAGDWAQIQATKEAAPYLMYDAIDDAATRPEHRRWDGTVLPVDDPWWATHRPPNGWNCRCSTVQLSAEEVERLGKKVAPRAPPVVLREHVNARTGEVTRVPRGIDAGFAYNPGASAVGGAHRNAFANAAKTYLDKLAAAPAELGAAAGSALSATEIQMLDRMHRDWVDRAFEHGERTARLDAGAATRADALQLQARLPGADRRVVGTLAPQTLAALRREGVEVPSAGIVLKQRLIHGPKGRRHAAAGDALTREQWGALPFALRAPSSVYLDRDKGTVVYAISQRGQRDVVRVVVDVRAGEVASASIVDPFYLVDEQRYALLLGTRFDAK
jgi:SPP1 gp7 family putative phage head morphogenesis protein